MKPNCFALAAGLFAIAAASLSKAAITVDVPPGYSYTNNPTIDGNEITITRTASGSSAIFVYASAATDKIKFIRVTRSGTQSGIAELHIGRTPGFPIASIGTIESINGSDVAIYGLYTSGDVGVISQMQRIDDMVIGGDVTGDITVIVDASTGRIGAQPQACRIEGDVLGEISVEGDLRKLEIRGSFGNAGGAARTMRAYGDIWNLTVGEVLNGAVIEARDGSNNLTSIQNLTIDDQWGASGDMNGEIIANAVEDVGGSDDPLVRIDGDLNGIIDLDSALGERILIGGSLGADAEINLPEDGLVGQISFNTAGGSATWAGDLVIDSVTYPEEYAALPSVIGGGAAGKAPFTTHDAACNPESGDSIFITGMDPLDPEFNCYDILDVNEILIRLYGPVELTGDPDTALDVMVRNPGAGTFNQVSFAIDIEIDSTLAEAGRLIRITRDDAGEWPIGQYKIQPKSGRVPCTDVAGPTNASFTYEFSLLDGCELMLLSTYDLNSDGTLCPADIAEWTQNPVDLNNDSVADGDDATLLINAVNAYNN